MCRTRMPYDVEQVRRLGERRSRITIGSHEPSGKVRDTTMFSQNYAGVLNAIESDRPTRFFISVADPAAISATFDRWARSRGLMGLSSSLPWRKRIQAAKSCIRICWLCDCREQL